MSSRLQLDVRNLSLGRRHLVKAGISVIAGNSVWSMPECLDSEVLHKVCYINTLTFTFTSSRAYIQSALNETVFTATEHLREFQNCRQRREIQTCYLQDGLSAATAVWLHGSVMTQHKMTTVLLVHQLIQLQRLCIFGPKGAIQIRYYYYYYYYYYSWIYPCLTASITHSPFFLLRLLCLDSFPR